MFIVSNFSVHNMNIAHQSSLFMKRFCNVFRKFPMISDASMVSHRAIQTFAILDIETTGLNLESDRITEIAILALTREDFIKSVSQNKCDLPRILSKICLPVNPGVPIPDDVTKLTGLKDKDLIKYGNFASAFAVISPFLDHLPRPICLISHYGRFFDFPFVRNELERNNAQLPENTFHLDTIDCFRSIDKEWFTAKTANLQVHACGNHIESLAKSIICNYKYQPTSYKQRDIYQRIFRQTPNSVHSAEGDCVALLDILLFYGMNFVEAADMAARRIEAA